MTGSDLHWKLFTDFTGEPMIWHEIGHVLWEMFDWPAGIVLGNLLASVIWSAVFEWRLRIHHKKIMQHIDNQGE